MKMMNYYDYLPSEYKDNLFVEGALEHIVVPERFSNRIVQHVVLNYVTNNSRYKVPLYLAIQGRPGEGKTTQAIASCTQKGICVKYISSSFLSGEFESESKEKLEEIYIQTQKMREKGFIVCILIDDFHLGNSDISSTNGRTVNAELLVSYMMNLVDKNQVNKIPFLLTGNDFSRTYKALLRDGRADIFNWLPCYEEKLQIVLRLYDSYLGELSEDDLICFVEKYSDQSIAFFSQIENDLRREQMCQILKKYNYIDLETISKIDTELLQSLYRVNKEKLISLADERLASRDWSGL